MTHLPHIQPPKTDKKKDTGKSKKDKDPVNKSGGKAKKKVLTHCEAFLLAALDLICLCG